MTRPQAVLGLSLLSGLWRALCTTLTPKAFGVGALAALLLVAPFVGAKGEIVAPHAGFDERVLTDAHRARTIPVALWYPTATAETTLPYSRAQTGQAAPGAPLAPGRWPLVIVSHGSGGNRFNQSTLGEALARKGFIVAALEHPGNRTFDDGASGTARNLLHRPQDVRFVLDALLGENSPIAAAIDGGRIAVIGHSVGGFTATVVGGGRPNISSLETYCRTNAATDPDTCPADRGLSPESLIERRYLAGGLSLADARVRAAILMAPAIGPLFDPSALADVSIPVMLFWAGKDEILNEPANSRRYVNGLRNVRDRAFPEIGHFTFLNECSAFLATAAPDICRDPLGVERAAVHEVIAGETEAFLRGVFRR